MRETHKEYGKYSHRWREMRGVLGGEDVLKGRTGEFKPREFIPPFVPDDDARYKALIQRAIFYNYTGNTHSGLLGAVFRKPQNINIPNALAYLLTNADGGGVGLSEYAEYIVSELLAVGRFGALVDPGKAVGSLPYYRSYQAEDIIDWATMVVNGNRILSRVVLREDGDKAGEYQYRVLSLTDGVYRQWTEDEAGKQISETTTSTKSDKSTFNYIPFQFFGASNNRPNIDKPPLYDIATINLGHYRNSADMEENLHMHGQGTTWITSELTPSQLREANPNGLVVGALAVNYLGPNSRAELLQLNEAAALSKEMNNKVRQMIGLGAQFIDDATTEQTATATVIQAGQRSSGLNKLVGNTVFGVINLLRWAADFIRMPEPVITYDINRVFYDRSLTAQEATAIIMLKDSGALAKSDVRHLLRLTGWIKGGRTDEDIDEEVETDG